MSSMANKGVFRKLAADAFIESLEKKRYRSHNKHFISYLPERERHELFDALYDRAKIHQNIKIRGRVDVRLRFIRLTSIDILPFLVVGDGELEGAKQRWGTNCGTEGFAGALRDYFDKFTKSRIRLLVVFTGNGDDEARPLNYVRTENASKQIETFDAVTDVAVDKNLLVLPNLCFELVKRHGIKITDTVRELVGTYLDYLPRESWDQTLSRLDSFLDEVEGKPVEEWGGHLDKLECFMRDPSPKYATKTLPFRLPQSMKEKRAGANTRLQSNAAVKAYLDETINSSVVETEQKLQSDFNGESANAIIEAGVDGLTEIEFDKLRRKKDTSRKNKFDWESLNITGDKHHRTLIGKKDQKNEKGRVLLVSTPGKARIENELEHPFDADQEHVHLLRWNQQRSGPRPVKNAAHFEQDSQKVTLTLEPDAEFEVYRAAITGSSRSYKSTHDEFLIAVYKTDQPVVAWENGLELSLEHEAWVRQGQKRASFKESTANGETEQRTLSFTSTEIRDEERDDGPESVELDAFVDSVRWGYVHDGKVDVRICWVEDVTVGTEKTYEMLELAPYRQSRKLEKKLVQALRKRDDGTYLSTLSDVTRDPDGFWYVEVAGTVRLRTKAWNEHGEEEAVAHLLAAPDRRNVRRESDGSYEFDAYPDAVVSSHTEFSRQRERVFDALLDIVPSRLGDDGDTVAQVQLLLADLDSVRDEIEAYYDAWLDAVETEVPEECNFGPGHEGLLQTDLFLHEGEDGSVERLIVLPTHPWLLRALLKFQLYFDDIVEHTTKSKRIEDVVTELEMEQLIPKRIVEDWFFGSQHARFRAEDATPFHLDFLPAKRFRQSAKLDYVARVVRNKLNRYLEMHRHLQDSRRTLRIGFVNPGDAKPLFDGIRAWFESNRPRAAGEHEAWLERTPKVDVILFEEDNGLAHRTGTAFDDFFREHLDSAGEKALDQAMLAKLRYGKRDYMLPDSKEDYVHICFASGLVDSDGYNDKDGAISDGWDGCFADGLMPTTLRRTVSTHIGEGNISERGLWVSPLENDDQRRGLANLLMLLRGAEGGMVDPDRGLYWRVNLPTLDKLDPMYENSDWVVHLDRELGLELFRGFGDQGPKIIEYSDQEDPHSPGFDIITLTRHAAPYLEQLGSVLHYADLEKSPDAGEAANRAANKLLDDINILSGSWALDFLVGNIAQERYVNRLKGNVGSALVFRWLRRIEEPVLETKFGPEVVPVYVSLEELVRATPAANLPMKHGLVQRYSNENDDSRTSKWCDDLLVLYLTPAQPDRPYKIFGRIIEVKFGKSATQRKKSGVKQVRGTFDLLEKHLGGGNEPLEAPFRHRQLSLLIKSQLEQAVSSGILTEARRDALNIPALSACLAAGRYEVDYVLSEGEQQRKGDLFLLSTPEATVDGSEDEQARIEPRDGVRVVTLNRKLLQWLAFTEDTAPTLHGELDHTLPGIGRIGESLTDVLSIETSDTSNTTRFVDPAEHEVGVISGESSTAEVSVDEEATPPEVEIEVPSDPPAEEDTDVEEVEEETPEKRTAPSMPLEVAKEKPLKDVEPDAERLQALIRRLSEEFEGHRIEVEAPPSIEEVEFGPRLIRVYVRLMPGETINSVRKRSEDIARRVGTSGPDIHIMNVPEKRAIALDLPISDMGYEVLFDDLRDHPSFDAAGYELDLGFCAGVGLTGNAHWVDLAEMPHALVAGTTGSGKTVFLRSIILTLILSHSPTELDVRLSSSKPMDFKIFTQLPHASARPMAESPADTLRLVTELVDEMDRRIERISEAFCDNLAQYNDDPDVDETLPRIVAVIDEFAETVLSFDDKSDRRAFEDAVGRLAQKARAAGIHLILCMQRPDSSVIQGAVKSNILHRFALKLPQNHDSRVILDEPGAEALLGKGDLLYKDAGSRTHRLQVPFLRSKALKRIVVEVTNRSRERDIAKEPTPVE